ncbi:hypothetical protein GWK47_004228 [Chionoecetes opilio]|uniref:G-protein coupled receptors family 1 profile domain-containing protein n=1 Tax=Chionoecetes opilio TaxID=41210 RepID=A0A8J4YMP2_CHIOP|nr:hypothetical protein GWK47_004228 [Chionoecetes opilio]
MNLSRRGITAARDVMCCETFLMKHYLIRALCSCFGVQFRIIWALLFFGPMVVISLVYCRIFHLLNHRALSLVSAEQRYHLRRNIKTVRTTALIVGTFVVGWGPAMVKFLLVCDECPIKPQSIDLTTNIALGVFVNITYCLKVFTDTFIYAVQLRDVRRAVQAMGRQLKKKVTGQRMEGPSRTVSRFSRTTSTRVSIGSPALRRYVWFSSGHQCRKAA